MALVSTLTVSDWAGATGAWAPFDTNRAVTNGAVRINATGTYPTLTANLRYDLTGSTFTVELLGVPAVSNGSTEAYAGLSLDGNNRIVIGWSNGNILGQRTVGGVMHSAGWTPYVPARHRFLRIREAVGAVHWESSPDGFFWTAIRPQEPAPFALTNLAPILMAGNWNAAPTPGAATFGRVNITDTVRGANRTVDFGAFTVSSPPTAAEVAALTGDGGRAPRYLAWYAIWPGTRFTLANLRAVDAMGAINYVTWEAFVNGTPGAAEDAVYNYSNILSGTHNGVIDAAAATVKQFGKLVYLRPFHEMNGNWYPWGVGVHGNTAAQHIQAWNYLRARFAAAGATNVRWVWSPNISYTGSAPIASVFPGSANVDVVALDGYNWGVKAGETTTWQPPTLLFDPTLAEIRAVSTAPLWIGETASAEDGGDKALWITAFFTWLSRQPDIEAFAWFHMIKERDWRVHSTPAAKVAFQDSIAKHAPHPTTAPWQPVTLGEGAVQTGGATVTLSNGTFTAPPSMSPQQLRFTVAGDRTVVSIAPARHGIQGPSGPVPIRMRVVPVAPAGPSGPDGSNIINYPFDVIPTGPEWSYTHGGAPVNPADWFWVEPGGWYDQELGPVPPELGNPLAPSLVFFSEANMTTTASLTHTFASAGTFGFWEAYSIDNGTATDYTAFSIDGVQVLRSDNAVGNAGNVRDNDGQHYVQGWTKRQFPVVAGRTYTFTWSLYLHPGATGNGPYEMYYLSTLHFLPSP